MRCHFIPIKTAIIKKESEKASKKAKKARKQERKEITSVEGLETRELCSAGGNVQCGSH